MEKSSVAIMLSDRILDFLIDYSKSHPNFIFGLRTRNSPLSKEERLNSGFWFPGTNDYIFISPYKNGDKNNHTKSIGFVIDLGKNLADSRCYLAIAFGGENNKSLVNFHNEVRVKLKINERINNFAYQREYINEDIISNLKSFIEIDKPQIDNLVIENKLEHKFFITRMVFEKNLQKTLAKRHNLYESSTDYDPDLEYKEGEYKNEWKQHKWYERNPELVRDYKASKKDIEKCPSCNENIFKKYSIKAIDLLELHHIIPLSAKQRAKSTNFNDLTLLCPSCHRAIHKYMSKEKDKTIDLKYFIELLTN